jgi:hypothetical protein
MFEDNVKFYSAVMQSETIVNYRRDGTAQPVPLHLLHRRSDPTITDRKVWDSLDSPVPWQSGQAVALLSILK